MYENMNSLATGMEGGYIVYQCMWFHVHVQGHSRACLHCLPVYHITASCLQHFQAAVYFRLSRYGLSSNTFCMFQCKKFTLCYYIFWIVRLDSIGTSLFSLCWSQQSYCIHCKSWQENHYFITKWKLLKTKIDGISLCFTFHHIKFHYIFFFRYF